MLLSPGTSSRRRLPAERCRGCKYCSCLEYTRNGQQVGLSQSENLRLFAQQRVSQLKLRRCCVLSHTCTLDLTLCVAQRVLRSVYLSLGGDSRVLVGRRTSVEAPQLSSY